jgi:hypothetical protein
LNELRDIRARPAAARGGICQTGRNVRLHFGSGVLRNLDKRIDGSNVRSREPSRRCHKRGPASWVRGQQACRIGGELSDDFVGKLGRRKEA